MSPISDESFVTMNFDGRWVPMEVMDAIFLLWAIGTVIVVAVLLWLGRFGNSKKMHQETLPGAAQGKRTKRKKICAAIEAY